MSGSETAVGGYPPHTLPRGSESGTTLLAPSNPRASRWPAWGRSALFSGPAFLLLAVFLLWPLLWVVGMSFTSWDGLGAIHWAGLNTWRGLIADSTFRAALRNTLLWIALAATVPVTLGFILAVAFWRAGPVIGSIGRAVAILPLLLPMAVAAVTWRIIYNPNDGPLNHFLGLIGLPRPDWLGDSRFAIWSLFAIMAWTATGFSVLVFGAALRSIDRSYFDLAAVEGAGPWSALRLILLPACRKTAALAIIVTVVIGSSVFELLSYVTSASNGVIMLPYDMYNRAFGGLNNVGSGAAEATIQIAIGAVLATAAFLVSGRHEGMAGEAVQVPRGRRRPAMVITIAAAILLLLPLGSDLLASTAGGAAGAIDPTGFRWPPNFSSFGTAWSSGIGSGLGQSLALGLVVVALTLALAFPAAFALAGRGVNAKPRATVLAVLIFTLLLPGEPYLIPLFYLVQQLHTGDVIGLILAESARELPFAILLLWVFIRALPPDILGAAELEAGTGFRMLYRIVAPLAAPIAAAVALWVFVTSWSETTLPNILLLNSTIQTAPVALATFAGVSDTEVNLLAAGSLLLIIPVLVVLLIGYGPAARGLRSAGRGLLS